MERCKTYNVIPKDDRCDARKVTCNSLEECAETAKIFFLTPCDIELNDEGVVASVSKNGKLADT